MSIVNRPDLIIGIDPDVKMSGVACVDVAEGTVVADALPLPQLLDYVIELASVPGRRVSVVVEASWSTAHNWHGKANDGKKVAGRKGYDVGRNHQTGMAIVEILKHRGIVVVEKRPLVKIWKGKDGKITHDEITAICGWNRKRSNQEERDALLLAWDFSEKIMKIGLQKRS